MNIDLDAAEAYKAAAVEAMRGACLAIVGPMASSNSLYAANAGQQAYNAIRALPLPDHAALLAAAMKLPEVAALVEALILKPEGWEPDSPQAAYERGWNAALAKITEAKP